MNNFHGVITALITPFKKDLSIDYDAFANIVDWQINSGVHGLLVNGTTAENPTLEEEEKIKLLKITQEVNNNRVPIMYSTGGNNTQKVIKDTQGIEKIGNIDGILSIVPYYNKPNQDGIFNHFKKIAQNTQLPIIIYNVPSRTVVSISVDTLVALSKINNVIGIKDALGSDLTRPIYMRNQITKEFSLLSAEDNTFISYLASGGNGIVSVTSNVAPDLCSNVYKSFINNNLQEAIDHHAKNIYLHDAMFSDNSPAPAKYALSLLGKCSEYCRLPIGQISDTAKEQVKSALKSLNLL